MFKRLFISPAARRRTSWLIAAVLILPLVLFFHASGQSSRAGPGGIAGTVFGKPVPWDTFQEHHRWVRRMWEQQAVGLPESFLASLLTGTTWDRLTLLAEAKRRRVHVDDAELAAFIRQAEAFQDEGRFIPERYDRYLRAIGTTPQAFEALLRDDLLIEKLRTLERGAVSVTDEDVRAAYLADHERLQARLLRFEAARFRPQVESALSEEDVRAHYEAHQEDVRVPERLTLEHAGLTQDALVAQQQPTEEELRAYYDERQSRFTSEDGAVRSFDEVRETVRQQWVEGRARAQLTDLALSLGEDVTKPLRFEEIAAARELPIHAAGPLVPRQARDERFAPDVPDPAILEAVATLPVGAMSRVIETDRGVFLARVTARLPSRIPPLDEVRPQVREQLIAERAKAAATQAAEAFHAKAAAQMASGLRVEELLALEPSLDAAVVEFTRTQAIEPIGYVEAVNTAAFATPLGQLTAVVDALQGAVILRPESRTPVDETAFAERRASLREELLERRRAEHLDRWLKDVRERAKVTSEIAKLSGSPP